MNTRQVLSRFGITAKKSLGQNFLNDDDALDRIVRAAEIEPDDTVVEIGPGLGILTEQLAERAKRVIAVELDSRMIPVLRSTLAGFDNVELVEGDALEIDLPSLAGGPYKVVANLPYYITSLVLRHLLESTPAPARIVVLIQKEVAERIVAKQGKLSLLAVSVQIYGRPGLAGDVPPTSFIPEPDVTSSILRIDVLPEPLVAAEDREWFFKVVSAGFSQSRKQLHNAIGRMLWFEPGGAIALLESVGIEPTLRAQNLSIDDWKRLAVALRDRRKPAE